MSKGYIASFSLISVFTDTAMCVPGVIEEELLSTVNEADRAMAGLVSAVVVAILLSFCLFYTI